jgi:hypothetical protein
MICDQTVNVVGPLKANKIKGYAVASKASRPHFPRCPPPNEAGRRVRAQHLVRAVAPKGTPKPIVDKLEAALQALKGSQRKDTDGRPRRRAGGADLYTRRAAYLAQVEIGRARSSESGRVRR